MTDDEAKATLAARVSRETMERLELYSDLLAKWQGTINLVAPSTLSQIWLRHMLDSAQVFDHLADTATRWIDFGSGGGFPGLVCAALAAEKRPDLQITLVESDLRKGAFLRETARQMGVRAGVLTRRVEDLQPANADVVSARALAPLATLCRYALPHLAPNGICLFQKGARYAEELETARQDWQMDATAIASVTDLEAVLLRLENLQHA